MASEVFRPSNGPLMVRNSLASGMGNPDDYKRRPSTQSGYRFGQLSHNSFFARHNPHPGRVRHIKGLLDVPICAVNDDGYFANPRYSMNFPPNAYNTSKINRYSKYYNMPANTINVNNQRHPINTITGLQYFMGKPLNFRIFGEAAKMRKGIIPTQEAWRDELKALKDAVGFSRPSDDKPAEVGRPRTTQYSAETGRLIPPPSRAMSRGASRQARREDFYNKYQQYLGNQEPDVEGMLMQMLCQILQTEDISAVQNWLVSAGDREKALVLDMIRSAVVTQDEYYNQHAAEFIEPERPRTSAHGDNNLTQKLEQMNLENERPYTGGNQDGRWSRYSWANQDPPKSRQSIVQREVIHEDAEDLGVQPINNEPFRQKPASANGPKPASALPPLKTESKPQTPKIKTPTEAKLRYSNTPQCEQDTDLLGTEAAN